MADLRTCPSLEDLQRMVLGKLADEDAERIQTHLDRCQKCLSALQQYVASDELLEDVQASRDVSGGPTKTLYLPIGMIREAVSTWIGARDGTCSDHDQLPPSLADFQSLLSPPQSADEIGRIGDFRVLRLLGVGGMAAVFEAEDTRLKRRVALKVLHPATAARAGAIERFLREAQSAAALKHENVVTIHQVGLHQETPFLVLELLHGETLEDHLARNVRLSVPEIIRIGREIAEGLAAAHARGLLHRDIKPANVWLEGPQRSSPVKSALSDNSRVDSVAAPDLSTRRPPGRSTSARVKILDFGLAKSWSAEPENSNAGMVIGTPRYMAPEQVSGDAVDPRTDLFSLGCVLYRMATGRAPFGGSDLLSVLRALACEEPLPVRTLNPQVPSALSDLIGQLMSKSPDGRPSSAQVVVRQLQAIADDLAAEKGGDEPATAPVAQDLIEHRGRGVQWLVGGVIGLVVLLPFGFLFGAQLIRIATNKGQVVIQIDDPQFEVTIRENHVAIQDRPGQTEITLTAGEHQLEVTVKEPTGEKTFTTDGFTLSRGGRKVIDVREELNKADTSRAVGLPKAVKSDSKIAILSDVAPSVPTPSDLERRAARWVLSLGGSVTVRVGHQANPIQVQPGQALPALDFELTKIGLQKCALTDAGLERLRGLTNLVELDLFGTRITDAGLEDLPVLTQLKTLVLTNTAVTDASLARLQGLTRLESLSLDGTQVTDSGLVHVPSLKNLRVLLLSWTHVTDAGLVHLENLPRLEDLYLRGMHVTDAGLAHLKGLTKIEFLALSSLRVTDSGLVHLQGLERLRHLALDATQVTDAGMVHLKGLKNLQVLNLNSTRVTDAGLAQLEGLTQLETLYLGGTSVTAAGLADLYRLKNLHVLGLRGAMQVRDAAVPRILHLQNLKDIDLLDTRVSAKGFTILKAAVPSHVHIAWSEPNYTAASAVLVAGGSIDIRLDGAATDRSVKAISELPSESFQVTRVNLAGVRRPLEDLLAFLKKPGVDALVSLDLSGTTISDANVERLKPFVALKELTLAETRITDAGLAQLQGLTGLRRLVLDGASIQGPGLLYLQKLPELADLRLGCQTLADFFISELVGLKKLERLSLAKSSVSDQGAQQLVQLTQLKELDLSHTKVTAARLAELKRSLPHCRIITATEIPSLQP